MAFWWWWLSWIIIGLTNVAKWIRKRSNMMMNEVFRSVVFLWKKLGEFTEEWRCCGPRWVRYKCEMELSLRSNWTSEDAKWTARFIAKTTLSLIQFLSFHHTTTRTRTAEPLHYVFFMACHHFSFSVYTPGVIVVHRQQAGGRSHKNSGSYEQNKI